MVTLLVSLLCTAVSSSTIKVFSSSTSPLRDSSSAFVKCCSISPVAFCQGDRTISSELNGFGGGKEEARKPTVFSFKLVCTLWMHASHCFSRAGGEWGEKGSREKRQQRVCLYLDCWLELIQFCLKCPNLLRRHV